MERAVDIFEKMHGKVCLAMEANVIKWNYNSKYEYQVVFFDCLAKEVAIAKIINKLNNKNGLYMSECFWNTDSRSSRSSVSTKRKHIEEFDQAVLNCHNQHLKSQTLIDFI